MGIERVTHYIDNVLTEAQARMGLSNTRLLVAWYTNWENKQSVVHSHPYHELVLPIGGSTVRYSVDGSVYLVHVGELVYFPSQIYHSGNFNIDDAQSDRLVIQIDDALWQATRRRVNLKNADWMHELTVLDSEACRKWDFKGLFIRMAQSQELSDSIRDIVFEAQVAEMLLLITQATGSGQTAAPSSTSVLVAHAVAYLQAHYEEMYAPFKQTLSGMFTADWYFEYTAPGIDKARALEGALPKLGIDASEVVSFGDGQNDKSMIEWAGTGVAMGNAVEEVKAVAQMVTADNNEDGIAVTLDKLLG